MYFCEIPSDDRYNFESALGLELAWLVLICRPPDLADGYMFSSKNSRLRSSPSRNAIPSGPPALSSWLTEEVLDDEGCKLLSSGHAIMTDALPKNRCGMLSGLFRWRRIRPWGFHRSVCMSDSVVSTIADTSTLRFVLRRYSASSSMSCSYKNTMICF